MLLQECCVPPASITTGEMLVPEEHPDPANKEMNEKEADDEVSMKYVPPSWISTPLELHDCAATATANIRSNDPVKNIASEFLPSAAYTPPFMSLKSTTFLLTRRLRDNSEN